MVQKNQTQCNVNFVVLVLEHVGLCWCLGGTLCATVVETAGTQVGWTMAASEPMYVCPVADPGICSYPCAWSCECFTWKLYIHREFWLPLGQARKCVQARRNFSVDALCPLCIGKLCSWSLFVRPPSLPPSLPSFLPCPMSISQWFAL